MQDTSSGVHSVSRYKRGIMSINFKQDHEGNRLKVCILCLGKSKNYKILDEDDEFDFLLNHPEATYIIANKDNLPKGVCQSCKVILSSLDTPNPRKLPIIDYKGLVDNVLIHTDDEKSSCECEICIIGRHKGNKKYDSTYIKTGKMQKGRSQTPSEAGAAGISREKSTSPVRAQLRCTKCFGVVEKGGHKNCNKIGKIENLIGVLTRQEKEQMVSKVLDEMFQEAEGGNVSLSRLHGKKMIIPNPNILMKNEARPFLAENFFLKAKKIFGMSGRSLVELARLYKEETGGSVVPYLKDKLITANHILDDFFEINVMTFCCEEDDEDDYFDIVESDGELIAAPDRDGTSVGKRGPRARFCVVCKDVLALINFLKERRHITSETRVKIGIDGKNKMCKVFQLVFL